MIVLLLSSLLWSISSREIVLLARRTGWKNNFTRDNFIFRKWKNFHPPANYLPSLAWFIRGYVPRTFWPTFSGCNLANFYSLSLSSRSARGWRVISAFLHGATITRSIVLLNFNVGRQRWPRDSRAGVWIWWKVPGRVWTLFENNGGAASRFNFANIISRKNKMTRTF